MPVHPFTPPRGRIETITIDSAALAGNLLRDPTARQVAIYLPAGYNATPREYPLFVGLAGITGSGLKTVDALEPRLAAPMRVGPSLAAVEAVLPELQATTR